MSRQKWNRLVSDPRWHLAVSTLVVATLLAGVSCHRQPVTTGLPSDAEGQAIALSERLELPEPRDQSWVGSQVCTECHADIARQYASHPMANSCTPAIKTIGGDETEGEFLAPDQRRYRSEVTSDGRMVHHESLSDDSGVIYDLAVEVNYAIGSGRRGRSYLAQKNGMLFQSPLTWYSQERRWDLSPGYSSFSHQRFERKIGDGCLYCHVGRPNQLESQQDVYAVPAFKEHSIGCERCHGPGEKHVAYHRQGKSGNDPIVNPSMLEPARREATCNICHLQGRVAFRRFGRGFFDFRPGDRLDDILLIYVDGERVEEQQTLPVSQVEQMQSSRCFQASLGKMGCTSCHDPHQLPSSATRTEFYRRKCLSCHTDASCSASREARFDDAVRDSCAQCHMPPLPTQGVAHTSLTDHRVLRRPTPGLSSKQSNDPFALQLYDGQDANSNSNSKIPKRELDRGRGFVLMEAARGLQSFDLAYKAQQLLVPERLRPLTFDYWLTALENDPESLDVLGQTWEMLDRTDVAMSFWEAVASAPGTATGSHYKLSQSYKQRGDFAAALKALKLVSERNPFAVQPFVEQAQILAEQGQLPEAIMAAQKGLACDPTRADLRALLAELYRKAGDPAAATREVEMARRIQAAIRQQPGPGN